MDIFDDVKHLQIKVLMFILPSPVSILLTGTTLLPYNSTATTFAAIP